jgi:hypothetical protein
MRRGGRRRRYITREDAAVSCPGGRWGRRRTRVTECVAIVLAEEVYTELIRGGSNLQGHAHASGSISLRGGRVHSFDFWLRPNAVWRNGRVFLRCPQCRGRSTRLYVPREDSWLACRRCWGLTYESRQQRNYKHRGPAWFPLLTMSDRAKMMTEEERERRRERSLERWSERNLLRRINQARAGLRRSSEV